MDQATTMGKVLDETKRVVDGIEPSQLDNPSPCDEWTVRDVLNHVTAGATMFAVCLRDGSISDERLGELMAGDNLGDEYKRAFGAAADEALVAFSQPGAMDKIVKLPFGEMPAGVAVNIAIFDVATHTWDLAKGTGQTTEFDPEVIGTAYELAVAMIPNMRAGGMIGEEVPVSDDAPMPDRLAALAGRTP
ncbi:MAG: TIGR03086 family metal-binding protein [Acidimicrobiia bacterium]